MEREQIRLQAKKIIDSFQAALDKAGIKESDASNVERETDRRAEKEPAEGSKDFRDRFLDNAPKKKHGFILAERGGWE